MSNVKQKAGKPAFSKIRMMLNKKIVLLGFLCSICFKNYSQSHKLISIAVKVVNGDSCWLPRQWMPTTAVENLNKYTLPTAYKTYRVGAFILNPVQEYFEELHQGKMSAETFNNLPKAYMIDTSKLYNGILKGNRINVFTAIDSVNKYIIVDSNNNYSFTDDKVFVLPLKGPHTDTPKTFVSITKYDGRKKINLSVPISVVPFDPDYGKTELEKSLDVAFIAGSMRLGKLKVNGKTYLIGLRNRNFGLTPSNNTDYVVQIRQSPLDLNDVNDFYYRPSDDIDIGGNIYHIVLLTDNALTLTFIKKSENGGGRLNTTAPEFERPDVMTNKPFKLSLHSRKYTIIDFWGSWCEPCIEALPMMVSAHDKYFDKVDFVNVAVDYSKDLAKLKAQITKSGLVWPQVWVDRLDRKNNPVTDYKINSFPTTILLDPNGLIIYRGIGADGLADIIKILQEKLGG